MKKTDLPVAYRKHDSFDIDSKALNKTVRYMEGKNNTIRKERGTYHSPDASYPKYLPNKTSVGSLSMLCLSRNCQFRYTFVQIF